MENHGRASLKADVALLLDHLGDCWEGRTVRRLLRDRDRLRDDLAERDRMAANKTSLAKTKRRAAEVARQTGWAKEDVMSFARQVAASGGTPGLPGPADFKRAWDLIREHGESAWSARAWEHSELTP